MTSKSQDGKATNWYVWVVQTHYATNVLLAVFDTQKQAIAMACDLHGAGIRPKELVSLREKSSHEQDDITRLIKWNTPKWINLNKEYKSLFEMTRYPTSEYLVICAVPKNINVYNYICDEFMSNQQDGWYVSNENLQDE